MKSYALNIFALVATVLFISAIIDGQTEIRRSISKGGLVEASNPGGRITLVNSKSETEVTLKLVERENGSGRLSSKANSRSIQVDVEGNSRADLEIAVPDHAVVRIKTIAGQITVNGNFARVDAESDTGTIYADTEFSNLKYKLLWTLSYPRFMSDVELAPIKEKAAGKHVIEGVGESKEEDAETDPDSAPGAREIFLKTARGIILLNVPPSEVPNDLLPKKITRAARTIVQSGDVVLARAIRRSAPSVFKDFANDAPRRSQPVLTDSVKTRFVTSAVKKVTVQVTDINNRAFSGLEKKDFLITERGISREIVKIEQSTAPFNLLLILDVSGSVENHVDFIRKAARSFVNTVDSKDRIAIVTFNDDVQKLASFTADKQALSESLDTFDAGGSTALYDAVGYGIVDSIHPLGGERSAIVILSDGDDNRSFLSFESLIGAIEESGSLIYPMYVPSSLIASSGDHNADLDPLRARYLTENLSSKAKEEGERLASVSGGVYFPISRLSELQRAYDDIVKQLRTAYTITFRSGESIVSGNRAAARLKVSVNKKDAFVKLGPVVEAGNE
ncbi:MAG: VWA domain-containing protein [Pyrinomonadaceae bacterium]|nr:VWA domain-containing protein [Pyrinomonadaceae bacterium]